jgi:hypothetical protein
MIVCAVCVCVCVCLPHWFHLSAIGEVEADLEQLESRATVFTKVLDLH